MARECPRNLSRAKPDAHRVHSREPPRASATAYCIPVGRLGLSICPSWRWRRCHRITSRSTGPLARVRSPWPVNVGVRRAQSHMLLCVRFGARVLAVLAVGVACSSPEPQFPAGDRRVVSVTGLEAFKTSADTVPRDFAQRHSPFWTPANQETADCESLLASSPLLSGLRAPLLNYHLQFAGVSLNKEHLVLVHGFCPQGPKTTSYTRFGGELVFVPYHWGTCYFEAYCALEKRQVRNVTFSTEGR